MNMRLACIPCFTRQALNTIRRSTNDPLLQRQAMNEVISRLKDVPYDVPPSYIANAVYGAVREVTGVEDCFACAKEQTNRHAMELLPKLRKEIDSSNDPLHTAIKIALVGNVVDLGIDRAFDLERDVTAMLASNITVDDYDVFREKLSKCKSLLYLCDNSGEIAFDRLLVEQLNRYCKVTATVKSLPIINDATMHDARVVGLTEVVPVVETGGRFIGVVWEQASDEFRRLFREADIILAKGQANFETLNERSEEIFFTLMVKCPEVAEVLGLDEGDKVFLRNRGWKRPAS